MAPRKLREAREKLERYYREVSTIILSRQNPATGLIPASVAITSHGDYRDAWVRDNVYSILAVWGVALAYRRLDDDDGRAYELEHATVKCMRGLLSSMMRQAEKVEQFKNTQALHHALHAKYNTATGSTVVGDHEWGHLQIDATSIFLLMLAQMTTSGLHIIYTVDEVDFIQNLVFYVERAYRTPDYGVWERGNKINHGQPELNCSSIGMATAALQAISGINLFGSRGGPHSVIHVLPDEMTRNVTTLNSALPRESASKEIDAALLSVISFPAFAVADKDIADRTRNEIIKKLGGRYGCKRFLRDGHQTVLEDSSRLHYEPHELKIFEGVESEWPLFFTYLILDGLFRDDAEQVERYRAMLEPLLINSTTMPQYSREYQYDDRDDFSSSRTRKVSYSKTLPPDSMGLVPELYIVPRELIEAERVNNGSQERVPGKNVPLVWAQSLYILGNLIYDGLISVSDIDPLNRHLQLKAVPQERDVVVQLVFLTESPQLQSKLRMYGLETQTVDNCAPITISPPSALRDAYEVLGVNPKVGLSGRPKRPIGTLSTCKIYRCQGQLYAFLPHFMDREEFYLVSDNDYLVSLFEQELAFVKNHWLSNGRPTMIVMLTHQMLGDLLRTEQKDRHPILDDHAINSRRNLLNFMMSLESSGVCNGVRVRVGRLSEIINTACIESLDFLVNTDSSDFEDWQGILRGREQFMQPADLVSHLAHRPSTSPESINSVVSARCAIRRFSVNSEVASGSKSPLADPFFREEIEEHEEFRLRDHREDEPSKLEIGGSVDPNMRSVSPARGSRNQRQSSTGSTDSKTTLATAAASSIYNSSTSNVASKGASRSPSPDHKNAVRASKLSDPSKLNGVGNVNGQLDDAGVPFYNASVSATDKDLLTLTLGEPSQLKSAINLLRRSANIYDQIDLLHYIFSCQGLEYIIEGFCSVHVLLEEVYVKAMHIKHWSIVRQAAGLLCKSVNSLTSNLTDLLVRQKPVTIGFGPQEFFIDSPRNPAALTDLIYSHCKSDIREPPLVQEIITYLGSFIRGSPQLFEGIMRVRTHFFIIAMREEISRLKHCDEEQAVELLMQLSPFELKSLMNMVLTARDQVDPNLDTTQASPVTNKGQHHRHVHIGEDHAPVLEENAILSVNLPKTVTLNVQSGGLQAGNFCKIVIIRDGEEHPVTDNFGRGLNMVIVDSIDGSVIETAHYDTCASRSDSDEFARRIERLESDAIVAISAKDDCMSSLTEAAKAACARLGSAKIGDVMYRDSWCIIGEKGLKPGQAVEFHRRAHLGPTEMIEKTYDLAERRALLVSGLPNSKYGALGRPSVSVPLVSTSSILPTGGRWLRRRKNDGALNRVPREFYPKVWKLLSKTVGIAIGKAFLPRDPTISEKTPEELNFALQVEALFDNIRDPAERQIAVECIVVISRIGERNPEIRLSGDKIDVLKLIRLAVASFWRDWVQNQGKCPPEVEVANPDTSVNGGFGTNGDGVDAKTGGSNPVAVAKASEAAAESKVKRGSVTAIDIARIEAHSRRLTNASNFSNNPSQRPSALHANLEIQDMIEITSGGPPSANNVTNSSPSAAVAAIAPTLAFEKNERLARRLFFDLQQDGEVGTMFYLASVCIRHIFEVSWGTA